jgi:predicted dehydrogenase
MSRLRMAVVGVGHLGKEHARILAGMPDVELVGVADVNAEQARLIAERCQTQAFTDYQDLLERVDAVSVVVPTLFHHQVARAFLKHGIPTLVEKPITTTVAQAEELIELARAAAVPLQVGHIERFNPTFEELVSRPIQPKFVESERHGPYTGRSTDIGAVLDLMIHDLDLLLTLIGGPVRDVEAIGAAAFGGHEDIVNARLRFANGCVAHVTASRLSQRPRRRLRIWAPEGYAGADFYQKRLILVQPSPELRRRGLQVANLDAARREALKDEVFGKHLQHIELHCTRPNDQLTNELRHFVECVRTGRRPRVSGEDGREALALAERILTSLRSHEWEGRPDGAIGPQQWPKPLGPLFELPNREAA